MLSRHYRHLIFTAKLCLLFDLDIRGLCFALMTNLEAGPRFAGICCSANLTTGSNPGGRTKKILKISRELTYTHIVDQSPYQELNLDSEI